MNQLGSKAQTGLYVFPGPSPYHLALLKTFLIKQQYEQHARLLLQRQYQFQIQRHNFQERYQLNNESEIMKSGTKLAIKAEPAQPNDSFSKIPTSLDHPANMINPYFGLKDKVLRADEINNVPFYNFHEPEINTCKIESEIFGSKIEVKQPRILEDIKKLKKTISEILNFFTETFGKVSAVEVEKERMKYVYNGSLTDIFDILSRKYFETAKCREDMIRLLIRKALTFMRNELGKERNLNIKQASLALCKKYFLQPSEIEKEKMEEKILEFFLPYKKNSRNKTPNSKFIEEAFLSKDFLQAYMRYLSKFDEIMKSDNGKKINKFADFIYDCMMNQTIHKIKDYKRLPWLNSWVETMKIIAHELLDRNMMAKQITK